jgi:hypothetical protein
MRWVLSFVGGAVLMTGVLKASPQSESTPWTKSYLETRTVASVERYSASYRGNRFSHTPKNRVQGTLFATSAPLQDWEFDLGIQGRSFPTGKIFIRAEHQIASDLEQDPLAVTIVVDGSTSGSQRARHPVYFEMAQHVGQIGLGFGRHLVNQKNAYTQVFGYLFGGLGSSRARFASAEIGVQQVFYKQHFLRLSFSHMKTFGQNHAKFRGIATIRTCVNTIACSYAYRFYSGIEIRLTYLRRMLTRSGIRSSTTYQLSVSLPIAL